MASQSHLAIAAHVSTPPLAASACSLAPPRVVTRGLLPRRALRPSALPRSRGAAVVCQAQGGQDTAIEVPDVTKSTWQSLVVESDLPVLVQFWASWCAPCKTIDPIVGKLSKEYEGKLKCFKLNTDENPDMTTKFDVRSIPAVLIFKGGKKKGAVVGAVPENFLVTCIETYVGKR